MEKHKYMEKCMSLLTTKYFKQVDKNSTKILESKDYNQKYGDHLKNWNQMFPHTN